MGVHVLWTVAIVLAIADVMMDVPAEALPPIVLLAVPANVLLVSMIVR